MHIDFNKIISLATKNVIDYAPKLFGAIIVLFVGFWLTKKLTTIIRTNIAKSSLSPEISSFLSSMLAITFKGAVLLFAAGIAGFDTSALVGILAAAGFAIGLALQGGLGNFASGIIILIFKPYKVGDWIEVQDKFGKVEEIQIFNTLIVTPGQKTLVVPNGQITENIVTNFSKKGFIRLEVFVSMPYSESYPKVKSIIENVLSKTDKLLLTPTAMIGIESYESHSIKIGVKPYINPENYWNVMYELNQNIKAAFHENGIQMAYSEGVELGTIGQ